jgi:hypothetical protein
MDTAVIRLALNSLALLGFKAETYCSEHTQLRSPPLDAHSFDKGNEKTLLLALHFLLSQLYPSFADSVSAVWPYYDAKDKNTFKVAAQECLDELASADLVPSECCKASVLSAAKGFIVWKLLWKLSNEVFRTLATEEEDSSDSSVSLQAAIKTQTTSSSSSAAAATDLEELQSILATEHDRMLYENSRVIRRQREQYTYADELWTRFKKAKKNIDKVERDILGLEMGEDTGPMLADTARLARTEMTMRIEAACGALQRVADSDGFRALKEQIKKGVSVYPDADGLSSAHTAQYLADLNENIMAKPGDRRYYAILDEHDINEHLDILIDKLRNSDNVIAGIPGSDFSQSRHRGHTEGSKWSRSSGDDDRLCAEMEAIPASIETIKETMRAIGTRMECISDWVAEKEN